MEKKELQSKIKSAFDSACPDILDDILQDIDSQKGMVITMKKKNNKRWIKPLVSIAACLVLVLGSLGIYSLYNSANREYSSIAIDINPSIELSLNKKDRVIEAKALNEDGKKILGSMDLNGADIDTAVNAIIGSTIKNGYISELSNSVLVSVDSDDPEKNKIIEDSVSELINKYLENADMESSVISQSFNSDDYEDIKEFAKENSISEGRAKYIFEICRLCPEYDKDELVNLNINELNILYESAKKSSDSINSNGHPSEKEYIGKDEAVKKAAEYAKVDIREMKNIEAKFDFDVIDGVPTILYEVEFILNEKEYEIEIDAKTGALADIDIDTLSENQQDDKSENQNIPAKDNQYKEKYENIALSHAGLTRKDVKQLNCEISKENGRTVYEVEFICGNIQYEYEIDKDTEKIIEIEKEHCHHHHCH